MTKSFTLRRATIVSSLADDPWIFNNLLFIEKPCSDSAFLRGIESIQSANVHNLKYFLLSSLPKISET